MSFSFGQNAGTSAPQSTPQGSTPLFGQQPQQQQQQQSGGLFGSTNQQPQQSGGLFGSTSQPQQSQQPGGLFGSTQQQSQPASGGLFGNQQQPASGSGAGTGTGLFGSTSQPQQGGSGLFGSTAQKPATGLFGSTNQPGQGSMFGQPGQQNQSQQQGGGLFGQPQTQQPQQQQSGGGLFGGGSLFGQQNQQTQQQPQTGLFGSTSQNQPSGGLFGSTTQQPQTQNSLFSSTTQPQQSSLFASTSQQPNQSGLFASTAQNPMNASYGAKPEVDIETRMMGIKNAWDSASPECRFKYYFYNIVEPGTTGQYGRPAGANDDTKWAKAMRENPDPQSMVPVLATGWGDVKKRVEMQERIASVHQERIKEISTALSQLSRTTSLSTSIRLAALQAQLTTLMHRLIHLVAQTPQFIPILQSTAFRQEESAVAKTLEGVKADLDGRSKPKQSNGGVVGLRGSNGTGTPKRGGESRMIGQVNELWGQVEEIRRLRKGIQGGREGWMGDERALAEVAEILSNQQLALQRLSELVNNSLFDADVMLPPK